MGRRRTVQLVVFALTIVLGVTAGVAHQKSLQDGRSDFLTEWTYLLTSPFLSAARYTADATNDFLGIFRTNSSLKRQVRELKTRNQQLRSDLIVVREQAEEAERLKDLLAIRSEVDFRTIAGRIIVRPATPWADTCTVRLGTEHGVSPGAAVIGPQGLVGQVFSAGDNTSQILLLSDSKSSVPALVQGSRAPGVCSGQGTGELVMEYIPIKSTVKQGDAVISSGEGTVFPKGLLIGYVISVDKGAHAHFKRALVRPAEDFRALEEVLVVAL